MALRRELSERTYRPGGYSVRTITRPKTRMISAAPFRDRVVHHALCRVIMPLFEQKMIFDLYSNREGKGTHAAIRRCQHYARRFPYALKCDIRKYFPSMDHGILKTTLRRTIGCRETLWLLDTIVDASNPQESVCTVFPGDDLAVAGAVRVGLPIGNLTSQWFGCVYLSDFDHWVKETLRCPGYLRYVDDFVLFGEERRQLTEWRAAIQGELAEMRLRLNERKSRTYQTRDGLTFLGQRVWPNRRRLVAPNVRAARRRLVWCARECARGALSPRSLSQRWYSWRGHAMEADSGTAVERIRGQIDGILGSAGIADASCGAARGTTTRTTCGAPTGTTTGRGTRTTTMASVV